MTLDTDLLVKTFNTKVAEKAYDDSLSIPLKETSELVTYFIKTAQLFCFPFQIAAAYQDRLKKRLQAVVEQVSPENRIDPPSSIMVPVVSHLNYIEDSNILVAVYQNLLARAMDKTRNSEAHPGFIITIGQLSPDEVLLLHHLKFNKFKFTRICDVDITSRKLSNFKIENNEFPIGKLSFADNFDMYLDHLEKLDLICVLDKQFIPITGINNIQIGISDTYTMGFTKFGDLFMKACLPDKQQTS
jgi:hypothetical protein